MHWLRNIERACWVVGIGLLVVYVSVRAHGELTRRADLARFDKAARAVASAAPETTPTAAAAGTPSDLAVDAAALEIPAVDVSLWSAERIRHYEETLSTDADLPLAVLRIPRIALEVPVLDGTDEFTLNRAVGRIAGTAGIDATGNLGIAGHRDGFFRGLKDIARGDTIELATLDSTRTYLIDEISIVDPSDTHVLDPTDRSVLTLVTCYPFYHIGKAPKRYIVRATLQPTDGAQAVAALD